MTPRPYQNDCLTALHNHICMLATNPCVVMPTGSGKSPCIAWAIQKWKQDAPWFRCVILAHRKELIEQNAAALEAIAPGLKVGAFSAALKRRDWEASVLYASIDSIFWRAGDFTPWDVIMVDEAHRIPLKGEGKYRRFIHESRKWNDQLRVIGWTATPFRLDGGPICHRDHILNEICYEVKVTDLIKQGFLCNLRSKVAETQPDLASAKKVGGDYTIKSLAKITNRDQIVTDAVSEAVRLLKAEGRKAVIFFCVDIEHCQRVNFELQKHGIHAPIVTSKTKQRDRDKIVRDFKARKINALCNVNVYTEGFDARHVDCIVLLRPTLSAGLYSQMVGRGLRIHEDKKDCLVLDFGGCIEQHGPIDLLGGEAVVMATCGNCRESFSRAVRVCPQCGWEIPRQEIDRLEGEERERRLHDRKASDRSILSTQPRICQVDAVHVNRHKKLGSPDSIRVQYRCGLSMYREWVCLDHPGYAGQKAQQWWAERFGRPKSGKVSVSDALENLFLSQGIMEHTKTITVRKNGKFWEIVAYNQPLQDTAL